YDPAVEGEERPVPYHAEILLLVLVGGVDAAVVDRSHRHLAGREQLRRLGAGLPPDNVVLDGVQLLEGALDALVGGHHLVDVLRRDAVGDQRNLQRGLRTLTQGALARILLGVEEVGPALRRVLQLVLVVAENEIVQDGADAAGIDGRRQIGGLATDLGIIDLLEQAFLAANRQLIALDLDDIPGGSATLDLGAQHADTPVP